MKECKLPIDTVTRDNGLLFFKWRQTVSTPIGPRTIEHEGPLPVTVEKAVAALVGITKQQAAAIEQLTAEVEELRRQVKGGGRSDGESS